MQVFQEDCCPTFILPFHYLVMEIGDLDVQSCSTAQVIQCSAMFRPTAMEDGQVAIRIQSISHSLSNGQ